MDNDLGFHLMQALHAVQTLQADFSADTREAFSAFLLLSLAVGAITGIVHGRGLEAMAQVAGRAVCCLALLVTYDAWFVAAVSAVDAVAASLRERTEYLNSLASIVNATAAFVEEQDSVLDMIAGIGKGTGLWWSNILSDYGVTTVLHMIVLLTLVALSLLYAFGPVLIAAGVFANGMTVRCWGASLFRVLMWPLFPCFVLVVNGYMNSNIQLASDNVSFGIASNLALALLFLLTPIAVNYLLAQGGVATMGAMAWGLGVGMAGRATFAAFGAAANALGAPGLPSFSASPTAGSSNNGDYGPPVRGYFERDERPSLFMPAGNNRAALPPPSPYLGPDDGGAPNWARSPHPPGPPPQPPSRVHPQDTLPASDVINAAGKRMFIPRNNFQKAGNP